MEKLFTLEYNPKTDGFHYNDGMMHADKDKSGWVTVEKYLTLGQCTKLLAALRKGVYETLSQPVRDLQANVMLMSIQDHKKINNDTND